MYKFYVSVYSLLYVYIILGIEQVFLNVGMGLINLSKDSLVTSLRIYDSENTPQTQTSGFPVRYGTVEDSRLEANLDKSLCC